MNKPSPELLSKFNEKYGSECFANAEKIFELIPWIILIIRKSCGRIYSNNSLVHFIGNLRIFPTPHNSLFDTLAGTTASRFPYDGDSFLRIEENIGAMVRPLHICIEFNDKEETASIKEIHHGNNHVNLTKYVKESLPGTLEFTGTWEETVSAWINLCNVSAKKINEMAFKEWD